MYVLNYQPFLERKIIAIIQAIFVTFISLSSLIHKSTYFTIFARSPSDPGAYKCINLKFLMMRL